MRAIPSDGWQRRIHRFYRLALTLWIAALLCVALSAASCSGGGTAIANPAANLVDVKVTVLDHQSAQGAPGATTHLEIVLIQNTSQPPTTFVSTEAKTLVCDGQTPLNLELQPDGSAAYLGDVPAQVDRYTCTYFWAFGRKSAVFVIPVPLTSALGVLSPPSGDTISIPDPGDPGITVEYSGSGATGAQVTATALDFIQRSATSGAGADIGEVTIPSSSFPTNFSVGWGTIALTRSVSNVDLTATPPNQALHSVHLDSFTQRTVTPVRWL
jgi:hypothetical protein